VCSPPWQFGTPLSPLLPPLLLCSRLEIASRLHWAAEWLVSLVVAVCVSQRRMVRVRCSPHWPCGAPSVTSPAAAAAALTFGDRILYAWGCWLLCAVVGAVIMSGASRRLPPTRSCQGLSLGSLAPGLRIGTGDNHQHPQICLTAAQPRPMRCKWMRGITAGREECWDTWPESGGECRKHAQAATN